MSFTFIVALRFLREGGLQTLLIIAGVAVGVAVMAFLSIIIRGVQRSIVDKTLETQAHVIVKAPDDETRPVMPVSGDAVASSVQKAPQRTRSIQDWQLALDVIGRNPSVTVSSPALVGAALAVRGAATRSVVAKGIIPETYRGIVPIAERILVGTLDLNPGEALFGKSLAADLGAGLGERVLLSTATNPGLSFRISGIFDFENEDVNSTLVLMSLGSAQSLLEMQGGASSIEIKVSEVFAAESEAAAISAATGLTAESWMERNSGLLSALRSQSVSSGMIQFFVALAVALGIASVLFVSVVQKSREIGILKAMGAGTGKVLRVFLIQGFVVGVAGSIVGCAAGAGLVVFFAAVARTPEGAPVLPFEFETWVFIRSALIAIVSGVLAGLPPARRAALLDPASVIRYG